MPEIGAYVRVSTMMQAENQDGSLRTQRAMIRDFAKRQFRTTNITYYEDAESGGTTNRKGWQKLYSDILAKKIKILVVVDQSRLNRNIEDKLEFLTTIQKCNVDLYDLNGKVNFEKSSDYLATVIKGLIDQVQREETSVRVAADMRSRVSRNLWNGGPVPYGFQENKDKKSLDVDKKEAGIVRRIYTKFLSCKSIRKTTFDINAEGGRTRLGQAFAITTIKRILQSPIYYGIYKYGRRTNDSIRISLRKNRTVAVKEDFIKPIVDAVMFNEVNEILTKNKQYPRRCHDSKHLLSGLMKCSHCGASLASYTAYDKRKDKYYHYYKCQGHLKKGPDFCMGNVVKKDAIEKIVFDTVANIRLYLNNASIEVPKNDVREMIRQLKTEIGKLKAKKTRLTDLYVEGEVQKEEYERLIAKYNAEMENIAQLVQREEEKSNSKPTINPEDYHGIDLTTILEGLEIEGQRLFLREIISEVRCARDGAVEIDIMNLPFMDTGFLTKNHTGRDSMQQPT